jgi:hypothetical protein
MNNARSRVTIVIHLDRYAIVKINTPGTDEAPYCHAERGIERSIMDRSTDQVIPARLEGETGRRAVELGDDDIWIVPRNGNALRCEVPLAIQTRIWPPCDVRGDV